MECSLVILALRLAVLKSKICSGRTLDKIKSYRCSREIRRAILIIVSVLNGGVKGK